MAGDINSKHGSATSASTLATALASLSSGSTATGAAFNVTTNKPLDVLFEITIDPGTTTGNKQAIVYAISSLDGTNYSDSTNISTNAAHVGTINLPDTNIVRSRAMSIAAAFGGTLPNYFKVLVYNDSGAAFNSTGNAAQYVEVSAQYT